MAAVVRAGATFKNVTLEQHLVGTGALLDHGRAAAINFNYVDLDSARMSGRGQSLLSKMAREDIFGNVTIFQVSTLMLINFSF